MCSLLQFPNTPGYDNDDAWNEDYRYEYEVWSEPVNRVPVWSFRCLLYAIIFYETMWYIIFRYVINTAMVHLRFVYLCVRLFLGHIWVFYASYFVLQIWVWQAKTQKVICNASSGSHESMWHHLSILRSKHRIKHK